MCWKSCVYCSQVQTKKNATKSVKNQPSSVRFQLENLLFTFHCSQPKIMPSICSQSKPVWFENLVFNFYKFRQRKRHQNLWKTKQVMSEWRRKTFCSQFTVPSQKLCPQLFLNQIPSKLKILFSMLQVQTKKRASKSVKNQPSCVRVELENLLFTVHCSQPKIMPSSCSQSKPVWVKNFVFNVHKFRQRKRQPNLWKTNQVVSESS